jgi:subtilisin family serine protease
MSTPHVAGAAALILQNNPDLTPGDVMVLLKENAVDLGIDKNISGSGRINISAGFQ